MRRVVTGHDSESRSIIVSDGPPPRTMEYRSVPGIALSVAWATEPDQPVSRTGADTTAEVKSVVPTPGGTCWVVLTFPPDATLASPEVDWPGFAVEHLQNAPGLAERFEPDGMHTTPTVDYVFVVEGEICLETDGGQLTTLKAGDLVVQNGTRHGWRNRSDKPAVIAAVLIGAPSDAT
ncbi:MAG TPA: cupin domain-containing protein [Pseudonocardiaceae bacterium]|nr:cupin domain-containing protein [Pseudonocardiaceae bacterium]